MESPRNPTDPRDLLEIQGVSLEYGTVRALREVSMRIHGGEVVAVVGEHGAGKSSLARVLAGLRQPSAGELVWRGARLTGLGAEAARALGIEMVPQHSGLFDGISVAENLFIGDRRKLLPSFFSSKRMAHDARSYLESLQWRIDPRTRVRNLTLADRVFLEIIRHLRFGPRLLILDESLEKLTQAGLNVVLPLLLALKAEGMAIISITHRVDDLYNFADRVAIMRNGEIFFDGAVNSIDKISLIRLAYTQIMRQEGSEDLAKEFHELLVYNEAIIDSLPVNLIVADASGAIRIVNNSAVDYFGSAESSLRQRSVEEFFLSMISPEDSAPFAEMMRWTLSGSGMRSMYNVRMAVNGESRTANVTASPVFDSSRCVGCMILVNDTTEQDKLRQQVILSEKLASVGMLAAGVAHEINNPLGVVFNYLDLMSFKLGEGELKDMVGKVESEVSSIQQIVSNLITLSDKRQQALACFDLNALLADIVDLVAFHAASGGGVIEFSPCEQGLPVTANRTEIKQVVLNLIRNGLEAMTSAGRLRISTNRDGEGASPAAIIVFEDEGPGIPSRKMGDIFLPFYSTKSGAGGNVGLGLWISYGIVQKHRGTIEVENLPERGCRFTVRLPLSVAEAAVKPPGV